MKLLTPLALGLAALVFAGCEATVVDGRHAGYSHRSSYYGARPGYYYRDGSYYRSGSYDSPRYRQTAVRRVGAYGSYDDGRYSTPRARYYHDGRSRYYGRDGQSTTVRIGL